MSERLDCLQPQGQLDATNSSVLEKQALDSIEAGGRRLLIDCAGLQYISSAGLRAVLVIAKRMKAAGGQLALSSMNPQIAEVFKVSGFNSILDIYASAEAARGKLAAG